MAQVHQYSVVPALPEQLRPLKELAYTLHWTWDHSIVDLFRRLNRDLWEETYHNPVKLLGMLPQERLIELSRDDAYLASLDRVYRHHVQHVGEWTTWWTRAHAYRSEACFAYFSSEFGLSECLPLYSGGLGVLSGDHLKSSSELGIPLVGVGLLYQQGYFQQYLSAGGWQQERYPINDFFNMPLTIERRDDGSPVIVDVPFPGRSVRAQIWRVQVGRVPLFLLDCNIPDNSPEDQDITDALYSGGLEMRICQEIMLGIGGMRALAALQIKPTVCHMNEGHSAFLSLERIRQAMVERGLDFAAARELCVAGTVFTTHTPVPAGFDRFSKELLEKYFSAYVQELGISLDDLLELGHVRNNSGDERFNMALLAIHTSSRINGVSKLHGEVSRKLFQPAFPKVPQAEVPVASITNGIHTRSWISRDMTELLNRYLGERWLKDPEDQTVWQRVEQIPNEELWRTHERRRERLVAVARLRLREQLVRRGAPRSVSAIADEVLDPAALTIGFARRVATYKRATLLLRDMERLGRILCATDRPVQVLYAGKAHPQDNDGKEFIRQIIHEAGAEELRRRIVYLENYDMVLARYLVQGCDIWLNTPRRPLEASGTSGMKVVFNGGLNVSILDGWWCEGFQPGLGWAIGRGEEYGDEEYQDKVESETLYDLLEGEVIPAFYDRGRDRLPRRWIAMMKAAMKQLGSKFNTNRMVYDYTTKIYLPAHKRYVDLAENGAARAKALAEYVQLVTSRWDDVSILAVQADKLADIKVGDQLAITAEVQLGSLRPEHVAVQIYDGHLDHQMKIPDGEALPMSWKRDLGDGKHEYEGSIFCRHSGRRGFTLRLLPRHDDLPNPHLLGLICWEHRDEGPESLAVGE